MSETDTSLEEIIMLFEAKEQRLAHIINKILKELGFFPEWLLDDSDMNVNELWEDTFFDQHIGRAIQNRNDKEAKVRELLKLELEETGGWLDLGEDDKARFLLAPQGNVAQQVIGVREWLKALNRKIRALEEDKRRAISERGRQIDMAAKGKHGSGDLKDDGSPDFYYKRKAQREAGG